MRKPENVHDVVGDTRRHPMDLDHPKRRVSGRDG
jgi:hypothetical protein